MMLVYSLSASSMFLSMFMRFYVMNASYIILQACWPLNKLKLYLVNLICIQMTKRHRSGQMMKCDYLDRLTFREIEVINEKHKRHSNCMFINVEFPKVVYDSLEYTVVYFEKVCK